MHCWWPAGPSEHSSSRCDSLALNPWTAGHGVTQRHGVAGRPDHTSFSKPLSELSRVRSYTCRLNFKDFSYFIFLRFPLVTCVEWQPRKGGFTLGDTLPVRCSSSLCFPFWVTSGRNQPQADPQYKACVTGWGSGCRSLHFWEQGAHRPAPLLPAPRRTKASERDLPHKTHFDLARCIFLS